MFCVIQGIGRNVGYKIPVTKLNKLGVLQIDEAAHSPREAELRALSELFSSACIVGKWSADAVQVYFNFLKELI